MVLCNIQEGGYLSHAVISIQFTEYVFECPFMMKTDPSPVDVRVLTHPLLAGMIDDHDVSPSR